MANASTARFKWDAVGEVLIGYGKAGKVSDQQWDDWVNALKAPEVTRVLNIADGSPEVNSVQRAKANEVIKQRQLVVAVVTDEVLLRGMVTAASWFVGNAIKAFSAKQISDAIAFLGAREHEALIIEKLEAIRDSFQEP